MLLVLLWQVYSILFSAGPGRGHIAVTIRLRRLMSNYFDHLLSLDAHLDSRTDS